MQLPRGFAAHVANVGVKDDTDDLVVLTSEAPCAAAGVFTRSRFAGASVVLSRAAVADRRLRAVVVVSKNANVATGRDGRADAEEIVIRVADAVGCESSDVAIASTGVIGVRLPMDRVRAGLATLDAASFTVTDAEAVARAMMTTDTHPKVAAAEAGAGAGARPATVVGVAKGVGMIEPDMATMLAFVVTDAQVHPDELDSMWRRVVDPTFNSLSVDTDTSTSDTAVVMANGLAGPVPTGELEAALVEVCTSLVRQLARDGEGATTLLVVDVIGARDDDQARRVAKAVVNSPLVKTAVHGADPNWGRVVMAVGKCSADTDIDPDRVVVRFGDAEVYPRPADPDALARLRSYLAGDEVVIGVELGIGPGCWRVYGCDLTDGYVRINADYTT